MVEPTKKEIEQMVRKKKRALYLIAGFVKSTLTDEERDELDIWICEDDMNMHLFEELTDERLYKQIHEISEAHYLLLERQKMWKKGIKRKSE